MDHDRVADILVHVHASVIAPRLGDLGADEVAMKPGDEPVTAVDRAAERLLGELLRDVVDAPIVGEEAVADDPSLLGMPATERAVWLVDPIDGTANFAAGTTAYAVMVAFVEDGTTTASWILRPGDDRPAMAALGAGATIGGQSVTVPVPDADPRRWRPVLKDRFLPDELRAQVGAAALRFGAPYDGPDCAGLEYPSLVSGDHELLFYWRTRPWDHAPGVLLAEEAGCLALRPDGTRYRPTDSLSGLVVAEASATPLVLATLLPDAT